MKKTIDINHRVVIPVSFLNELGLKRGDEVEIEKIDNKIIITNPIGMHSYEEIKEMYNKVKRIEDKSEYNIGFEEALKFVLRK